MKQRLLSLLLAGAVVMSLLGASALAAEDTEDTAAAQDSSAAQSEESGQTARAGQADPAALEGEAPAEEGEAPRDGGPAGEESPEEEYIPDPVGTITFQNLERRLREGDLGLLALDENIKAIQAVDYDVMYEDIRKGLNQIAQAQWQMITQIPMGMGSMMAASMDAQYDALRDTFEDLKEGKVQQDAADAVRQLRSAQDQVVMAAESLYIGLLSMELQDRSLDRSLAALDRGLEELELRYQLGHVSSQTVKQTRASRTSLVSGQQTLETNLRANKMQLELMLGAELTGEIRLGALPQVTNSQLESMDLENDLAAAKEASYSLYDAKLTLDDAYEKYKDDGGQYASTSKKYEYQVAAHTYEAAKYNYSASVQNFEMSFRKLYLQVKDDKQVLDAAKTALAVERDNCAVARLKYEQGSISQNALLDAEDKVDAAQETADTAAMELFAAYHKYRWAVDHGILN